MGSILIEHGVDADTALLGVRCGELAEAIGVERLSDASYRLSWQPTRPGAKVDVLVAAISGADAATRLVARQVQGDAVVVTVPVTPRPYFLLRSRGATDVWVAERVLPLAGGQNFRDLGGYRTHDGRQVRWGALFRSGTEIAKA